MNPLRLGIWTQQGLPWESQVEHWQLVESLGFDCIALADHFMPTRGDEDDPFLEAWTLLAALATQTSKVRITIIVAGNTYRNPVVLAKQAVTVDHISGGRLDLGIGAGWFQREHSAYGFDFPSPGVRVDMLREAVEVIRDLSRGGRTTYEGAYYRLDDAPFAPLSLQPGGIPLMIAGQKDRMLGLAAAYADIWNINHSPTVMAQRGRVLDQHCRSIGRDLESIRRSAFSFPQVLDRDPFASVSDFRQVALDYIHAGADDIQFRMPESSGLATLRAVPDIFDDLREAHSQRPPRGR